MNEKGKDFIRLQSSRYQAACAKKQDLSPKWKDYSNIEERAMRLGIENRVYELELVPDNPWQMSEDLEQMAIATLKQDYADRVLGNES